MHVWSFITSEVGKGDEGWMTKSKIAICIYIFWIQDDWALGPNLTGPHFLGTKKSLSLKKIVKLGCIYICLHSLVSVQIAGKVWRLPIMKRHTQNTEQRKPT